MCFATVKDHRPVQVGKNMGMFVPEPQTINATASQAVATVIIGRSALSREGLVCILSAGGFQVAGSASCVGDLAHNSIRLDQPVLVIIDAGDELETAIKEIELIKQQRPAARIAVLARTDQIRNLASLLRAGAHAFFARTVTPNVFLKSLEFVMLGETLLPQEGLAFILGREDEASRGALADRVWSPSNDPTAKLEVGEKVKCVKSNGDPADPQSNGAPRLSAQEARILRHLTEGSSNKAIARAIEIAEATVKVHVKAIIRKIGVINRTQAAMWAMRNPPTEWK